MKYLLDTNHWSYLHRREPGVVARLASLPKATPACMSVISRGELVAGIEMLADGRRKAKLRRFFDEIQVQATVLGIDHRIAECYGKVLADLRRKGRPIATNDMWIGATALVHDLVLATNDAHFKSIEGLKIEDWTTPVAP